MDRPAHQPPPVPVDEKMAIAQVATAIGSLAEAMAGIRAELKTANEELHRFLATRKNPSR